MNPAERQSSGPGAAAPPLAERKIGIGELEVVQGEFVLRTLLGSCIGLVLHEPSTRIGGLAHIVHPHANGQTDMPGKYADSAFHEMLKQIERLGGKRRNVTAKFAGGANMFATTGPNSIGEKNAAAVEELLKDAGIPVTGRDCGGQQGRRLTYYVGTGKIIVERVGSPQLEL